MAVVFSSIGLLHKIIPIHLLCPLNWNGFQHQWWVCFSLCKSKTNQPKKKKTLGFYRPEEFMGLWDESRCNWAIRSDRENEGVDWNRSLPFWQKFTIAMFYCSIADSTSNYEQKWFLSRASQQKTTVSKATSCFVLFCNEISWLAIHHCIMD